jgi:hypothetical protein
VVTVLAPSDRPLAENVRLLLSETDCSCCLAASHCVTAKAGLESEADVRWKGEPARYPRTTLSGTPTSAFLRLELPAAALVARLSDLDQLASAKPGALHYLGQGSTCNLLRKQRLKKETSYSKVRVFELVELCRSQVGTQVQLLLREQRVV